MIKHYAGPNNNYLSLKVLSHLIGPDWHSKRLLLVRDNYKSLNQILYKKKTKTKKPKKKLDVHVRAKSYMVYNTYLVNVQCTYQVVDGIQHKTCPDHDGSWRPHQRGVVAIV